MVNIGVITSREMKKLVQENIKKFPNLRPILRTIDHVEDAIQTTQDLSSDCDVLLYAEYFYYVNCKDYITSNISAHYIPIKNESLYRAIYRLKNKVNTIDTFSIDTLTEDETRHLNEQLDELFHPIHYTHKTSFPNIRDILLFHENLYVNHHTEGVLTGIQGVSKQLDEKEIPNEYVLPTNGDIIVSLERALLATKHRQKSELQIVFGLIHVDNLEQLKRQITSDQKYQHIQLDIQRTILDFIDELDGYLNSLGDNEYMFVTTRGTFERVTQGYKYFPLIANIRKQHNVNISVGVGFGVTANEAGTHARMALLQAIEQGGKKCFIVREDRSVIGPVENSIPHTYPLNITDKEVLAKTINSSISPFQLGRVISILNRKNKDTFTANELASSLGITTRSANRMLTEWLDNQIVEIVGMERLHSRGRPRQVYRLLIHKVENIHL